MELNSSGAGVIGRFCVMAQPVGFLLCLCLSLLMTGAKNVGQREEQQSDVHAPPSGVKPEPLWTEKQLRSPDDPHAPEKSLPHPEMVDLDLDRHQRLARGADEDEQQSTFGHSFENEWVTVPQVTEFGNTTKVEAENVSHKNDLHKNTSSSDGGVPRPFNPFYPLVENSYVAYVVLFLACLVLAVGVVGNMAVMCIVWNNYYMRSSWNYLLASMAFWDFLVLVVCLPVVVLNHLSHRRILGDVTCRMVPYMEVSGSKEILI